jgi:hypothetical protein
MKVTPRTEEEILYLLLLPEGEYDFMVFSSIDKISEAGNEMIHITLSIKHNNKNYFVNDYLLDTDKMSFKLRHLCESLNLMDKYNSGNLDSFELLNKIGRVKISIQKDKNGKYGPQNVVKDYLIINNNENDNFIDDKIPF